MKPVKQLTVKKLTSAHLEAFQCLHIPIWIYDPQDWKLYRENHAAFNLANFSQGESQNRDFNRELSSEINRLLSNDLEGLRRGKMIEINCRFDRGGEPINLRCYCSGIETEDRKFAVLVEGYIQDSPQIDPETLRLLQAWRHTSFMLSLYTLDGKLLLQNPTAENCYGNEKNSKNSPAVFLNRFLDPAVGREALARINEGEMFTAETQVNTDKGLCWHRIEARKTEDPVTGNTVILVNEKDINDRRQAEENLRESQHFLQKLTNTVPQILYLFDLSENKTLYLNERSIEILGYTSEEICTWDYQVLFDHFHPKDQYLCDSLPHRFDHLKDDEILSTEYRFRHKNGEWRWLNCREIVFQRDADGKPLQVLGSVTDISDRKQAEISLQSLSNYLQHLLTSSPAVIYSCQPEGNCGVTYISENVKTIFGFDADTFLKNPHNFWHSRLHPEDLTVISEGIKTLFQQGESTFEYRFLHADQTYRWIYDHANLIKNERGQPTEIIGYIIDISDRKRAELDLKSKTEVLEAIFDNIPIMLAFFNSEGRIEFINRELEEVLGWSLSEWQQENLLLKCYPDPENYQRVVEHMQTANRQWQDFQTRTARGEIVETSWTNIHLSNGTKIGIGQDITARKQNEKQLKEQARREKLITLVTQRIRQSLNLGDILETTVAEIRQLLQTDRALIYRFEPDKRGIVIAESVREPWLSLRGIILFDEGLVSESCINAYARGRIQNTPDIFNSGLADCYMKLLAEFQVRANLVIPIIYGEELWGLLVAQHCSEARAWQTAEIELLRQLADQVAIAISQSELYEYAQHLATHDKLTQLPNRRYFDEYLTQEWHRLMRERGFLSIILCDVDYFKRYNDTYGHPTGDECLVKVAGAIRRGIKRPADLAARYGGEEFVIILPNTNIAGAIQVVQNIQANIVSLNIPHESSSASSQITLSFGISQAHPTRETHPESLVKKADLALYQAKENGRNCYYYIGD